MKPKIYRRASAGTISMFVRGRVYLGPDHLLEVQSFGYTETYRRYFFSDIQGFTVVKTQWSTVGNIALSLFGGFLVLAFLGATGGGSLLAPAIVAGSFGVLVGANVILGPTCKVFIQTPIQRQRLPGLNRLRRTRWLLRQVEQRIQTTQGAFSREDILNRVRGLRLTPGTPASQLVQPIEAPPVIDDAGGGAA